MPPRKARARHGFLELAALSRRYFAAPNSALRRLIDDRLSLDAMEQLHTAAQAQSLRLFGLLQVLSDGFLGLWVPEQGDL
jgi:hypothetical protein